MTGSEANVINYVAEFLSISNQQHLFVTIVEGFIPNEDSDFGWSNPSGKSLMKRFFNYFAKNWVKILSGDGTGGRDMKIAKLGGQW